MKSRIVLALCAVLAFSLSIALGQSKDDCAVKCSAATKASCCMHGAKASLTSAAKNSNDASIIPVANTGDIASASGKDAAVKSAKNSADCNMTKASATGMKAGCCASKAKGAHAKNTIKSGKKSIDKVTEAKGTN